MEIELRLAKLEDAQEVLDIYVPYIINSNVTFEYNAPSLDEFENRMKVIMKKYPYIVAVYQEKIVGYAYAHAHMERAAYQWNVETSIYIKADLKHQGIGTLLYCKLIEILKVQNVQNVYGCVTLPNENSERMHYAFGFQLVGKFHNTGYKFSKWHDVGWFELHIGNQLEIALSTENSQEQMVLEEVIPISEITEQVNKILESR